MSTESKPSNSKARRRWANLGILAFAIAIVAVITMIEKEESNRAQHQALEPATARSSESAAKASETESAPPRQTQDPLAVDLNKWPQNETPPENIPVPPSKSLAQIFADDDLCSLDQYELAYPPSGEWTKPGRSRSISLYFEDSPFHSRYEEFQKSIETGASGTSRLSKFFAALRLANWVATTQPMDLKPDKKKAVAAFRELADEDPDNALAPAFAFALSENPSVRREMRGRIFKASRFDSYQMGFLRELASLDDITATGYLVRVAYVSSLAIPQWIEFSKSFKAATENDIDTRLRIADLMIQNAKEAKYPSHKLGYSTVESATARSLAGSARALPNFVELDREFESRTQNRATTWEEIGYEMGHCTKEHADKVRAFLKRVKSEQGFVDFSF